MARDLILPKEQLIKTIGEFQINKYSDKIIIICVIDTGVDVDATLSLQEGPGDNWTLKLWNEEEYLKIGQWSDEDVNNRIKQLLNL